jgi:hypothetical protein
VVDVAIVTPAYDGRLHDDHARSVEAGRYALKSAGISNVRLCLNGDAVLPRVRNQCVAEALMHGAKKIVFVDSDIGFDAAMLLRLLSHDVPLVGAAAQNTLRTWRDAASPRCVWRPFPGENRTDERGLVRADGLSTAFMAAKAEVFKEMVAQGVAQRYVYPGMPPQSWPFLASYFEYGLVPLDLERDPALKAQCDEMGIPAEDRFRMEGEDYTLCSKARHCGFESYLDIGIGVRHWEGRSKHDFSMAEAMGVTAP